MSRALPFASFVAAVLALLPLPWHWRIENTPAIAMAFWLCLRGVIYGVNAIIVGNGVEVTSPIWCDIGTKLLVAVEVALPTASLCMVEQLEHVTSDYSDDTETENKKRRAMFQGLLCILLPTFFGACSVLAQANRFDIIEDLGCIPSIVAPGIIGTVGICIIPLACSFVTAIFAGITLRNFMNDGIMFEEDISSRLSFSMLQYWQLLVLAILETLLDAVSVSLRLWTGTLKAGTVAGWGNDSWKFSQIGLFPSGLTPPFLRTYYYTIWWFSPVESLVFFCCFAFSSKAALEFVKVKILRRRLPEPVSVIARPVSLRIMVTPQSETWSERTLTPHPRYEKMFTISLNGGRGSSDHIIPFPPGGATGPTARTPQEVPSTPSSSSSFSISPVQPAVTMRRL